MEKSRGGWVGPTQLPGKATADKTFRDYLHDRLAALHSRQRPDAPARIPAKRVERYAKLEENIIKYVSLNPPVNLRLC